MDEQHEVWIRFYYAHTGKVCVSVTDNAGKDFACEATPENLRTIFLMSYALRKDGSKVYVR